MHHLVVGFLVVVAVLSQKMRFQLHATDLVQGQCLQVPYCLSLLPNHRDQSSPPHQRVSEMEGRF